MCRVEMLATVVVMEAAAVVVDGQAPVFVREEMAAMAGRIKGW